MYVCVYKFLVKTLRYPTELLLFDYLFNKEHSPNFMNLKKTNTANFALKIGIIFLSFITPFIMFFSYGKMPSISSYWNTPLQFLFILSNALTTYVFMDLPKWKLSGVFLFLLTIFSLEYYNDLHDILATIFFIVNLYPLYSLQRYRIVIVPYLLSCIWLPDLFWFEVHAITVLCMYHLNLLIKVRHITK